MTIRTARHRVRSAVVLLLAGAAAVLALGPAGEPSAVAQSAWLDGEPILSRPTDHGITLRAIADRDVTAWVEFRSGDDDWSATPRVDAQSGQPFDIVLDTLAPDLEYRYRLMLQAVDAEGPPVAGAERRFHTRRTSGRAFTFAVQADPHLDENSDPDIYRQTLRNQLEAQPDFLVDLGDAAMSDRCIISGDVLCQRTKATAYDQVAARNALMRRYFAEVGHSVPLFMAMGNHEAESGWATTGSAATLAEWSRQARLFHFANPEPDGFYTGTPERDDRGIGRQNYYAFEWGDALFVVLDPFAYTTRKATQYADAHMWNWTLGEAQYRWLADTLASSPARFKFVFSHHMTGGGAAEVRGAAAFASLFEWGGRNLDGSWGFDRYRPGWERPIQQLFVDHGVTIWFHGHDHLYAREVVDGVVYQAVPQPSTARYQGPDLAAQYGYDATPGETAFVLPSYLRVRVGEAVTVDLVRTVLPGDQTRTLVNGDVVTSYTVR